MKRYTRSDSVGGYHADIKASTHTDLVNKIYSVMMNYEYGYDPDMTDINSMLQELTSKGVHVDTSNAFKKAWVSAHNKAERKTWGGSGDSYRYDSLTPRELDAIENYDTEYWEYVKDHPLNIKPAEIQWSYAPDDVTGSTKYGADMCNKGDLFMKKYIKTSSSGLVYENYGDVNFLDGGCIIAKDGDYYNVVTCDFVYDTPGDHNYLIQDCYVDIDDSWIDQEAVERTCGCSKDESPDWFAKCCVDYYGGENFGANVPPSGLSNYDDYLYTAEGVEQYMRGRYNLPSDIYFG